MQKDGGGTHNGIPDCPGPFCSSASPGTDDPISGSIVGATRYEFGPPQSLSGPADAEAVVTATRLKRPKFCDSLAFNVLDSFDNAGSVMADVGAVAIVAGAVQIAATPITAGVSGATGLSTGALGIGAVSLGSTVQIVSKFGKFAISGGNSYFAFDFAVNQLSLGLGIRQKPTQRSRQPFQVRQFPKEELIHAPD